MSNTFSDYKVLESNTFHLNKDVAHPDDILLYKNMSFQLPESYVAGTNFAMPVLQFLIKPQIADSKLFIFVNSTPNYEGRGTIDLTHNRDHLVFNSRIEGGPLRMLSSVFTGTRLQPGTNNIAFAIEQRGAHWVDNVVLFYQRDLD